MGGSSSLYHHHHFGRETLEPVCHHSVHVKVSLQDSLLEGIRLGPLRLLWLMLDGCSLDRGLGHLGDGLCPIVDRVAAGWRGGREREGRTSTSDGALCTRPKLLGPVETLLVWARITVRWGSWILGVACLWERRGDAWTACRRQGGRDARPLRR